VQSDDSPGQVDRFTQGIIRRKAKQLVGRTGFTEHDREDIQQDLLVRILQGLRRFDPSRGHRNRFITTVAERYVANILRNKQAQKRDHRRVSSLNQTVETTSGKPVRLERAISDRERNSHLYRHQRSDEELAQLALDMAEVIASLPESWQMLLKLRKTRTMAKIASELGVPRTTLNDQMRRIRQRFEDAGMREYLEESPSSRLPTG
jgi:RNA polymerase sigma-70 factor (ECF subfamily)